MRQSLLVLIIISTLVGILLCILLFMIVTSFAITEDFQLLNARDLDDSRPLIFVIGLPRTGTCSLSAALSHLGWRTTHYPLNFEVDPDKYLRKMNAIADVTMLGFSPLELYNRFPEACFINTKVRADTSHWSRSMLNLYNIINRYRCFRKVKHILKHYRETFGMTIDSILAAKRTHDKECNMLRNNADCRFLDIALTDKHITSEEKWEKLCMFLDIDTPPSRQFFHESHLSYTVKQAYGCAPKARKELSV